MRISSLIVVFVIGLILPTTFPVFGQEILPADLWYPGGPDSYWIYETPSIGKVKATVVGEKRIDGKMYKVVEEDKFLVGALFGPEAVPAPFLTFRGVKEDGISRIKGYGVAASKCSEEMVWEIFAGFPKDSIKVDFGGNEWLLLRGSVVGGRKWTVNETKVEVKFFGAKTTGSFMIEGRIPQMREVETEAGEFDTFVLDYTVVNEIQGDIKKMPLCTMWLAPEVGLVQLKIGDEIAKLVEYRITLPVFPQQKVVSFGRLYTTWAALKRN